MRFRGRTGDHGHGPILVGGLFWKSQLRSMFQESAWWFFSHVCAANCTKRLRTPYEKTPGHSPYRHANCSMFKVVWFSEPSQLHQPTAFIRYRTETRSFAFNSGVEIVLWLMLRKLGEEKTDHSLKLFQVIQEEKGELTAPCPLNSLFSLILGRNQNGCQEFEAALHHANQICAGQFMKVSYHLSYLSQVSVRRFPSLGMYVRLIVC